MSLIEFMEKPFHIKIICHEYTELNNLPIGIRGLYDITIASVTETKFLVMKPNKKTNLSYMRKHYLIVKKQSGLKPVCYYRWYSM